ncbi:MAG: FtsW/RodA/SpoVE family cell cycle protein, partial [Pseudomonadota bacterium]
MVSRADRSFLAEWWRTIDRPLMCAILLLMFCGLMLSFAASPPVAERLGLDEFHFLKRHVIFLIPAAILMIGCSMMDSVQVRRAALVLYGISIALLLLTLFAGIEAKGSRRWLYIAGFTLQPSEFVKPAFVVITAWLFAENSIRPDIPGNLFSIILSDSGSAGSSRTASWAGIIIGVSLAGVCRTRIARASTASARVGASCAFV